MANSASRHIITTLLANLKATFNDRRIIFESYQQYTSDIEDRTDIPMARIALYEIAESVQDKVDPYWANFSEVTYGIDISVVRAYQRDDSSRGELPLLDIKDKIIDWANGFYAGVVTDERALTFSYDGSNAILRNQKYVTMTMTFTAKKDLSSTQQQ
jgi:hypothetical protein